MCRRPLPPHHRHLLLPQGRGRQRGATQDGSVADPGGKHSLLFEYWSNFVRMLAEFCSTFLICSKLVRKAMEPRLRNTGLSG